MGNSLKRFLAMVLALVMVIGMMPTNFAFATETDNEKDWRIVATQYDGKTYCATYDQDKFEDLSLGKILDEGEKAVANHNTFAALTNKNPITDPVYAIELYTDITEGGEFPGKVLNHEVTIKGMVENVNIVLTTKDAKLSNVILENVVVTTNVEGCEVVEENGVYSVVKTQPAVNYVAMIGDTEYATLAEAVAAANAMESATVIVLSDVELEGSLVITGTVTLDLNGKTIEFNVNSSNAAINVTGTLTLVDSSAEKTGKIVRNSNTDCSAIALSGGNLIVESGSVISNYKGIQLGGTGKTNTITIKGGVIEGATVALNVNKGSNTISITGGKLQSKVNAIHAASENGDIIAAFTISGGEFVGNLLDIPEGKLSITGGTFSVDPSAYVAKGYVVGETTGVWTVAKESITGTITENMVWEDGTEVGNVTISGNVTITVNGTVTVAGTIRMSPDKISKATFIGANDAKLIRGGDFTGQMFYTEGASGNFHTLNFQNITLDGGAVWTGDVDKTLNRGTTNEGVKATGSVLYLLYTNATLTNSTLQNHDDSTGEKANAVFLRYYSTIEFNNSVVRNNHSPSGYYKGGVITVRQGGTAKTYDSEVYGNSGNTGGFFGISATGSFGGIAEAYNTKFHNNYADNGAVFMMQCNSNVGYLKIDGCEFYNNASKTAVLTEWAYSRPFIISNSYFHDNECAVWDCHTDPVLDLSGKIVIEEDPDYTKYLFETPLVLSAPLAEGSYIAMSEASITKLGGCVVAGNSDYAVTEADLAKFVLPEGYAFVEVDATGDGIGDAVAVKGEVTEIKLTLKDALDEEASEVGTVYSEVVCLPVNPFFHEVLTFAGWVDADGNAVAKQKFTETATLTATWKVEAPVVKLSRKDQGANINTLVATVTNKYDNITYTYQWYKTDVAIEGATSAEYAITETAKYKCVVTASVDGAASTTGSASGTADLREVPKNYVAMVGGQTYESLAEAVAAANAVEGGATIELLQNVTLDEKLTITGNVTISGSSTNRSSGSITRADNYTGTLFQVEAGATLTLDGGLVIDGGNNWTFDAEGYNAALEANDGTNYSGFAFATSEEGAPVAKAKMFVVNGSLIMNSVTVQNHMGNSSCGLIGLNSNAALTLNEGATFKHNATAHSSVVAYVAAGATVTINDGVLITDNYYAKNGGIFQSAGLITMNGGEISHNVGVNTNGTVAMMATNNAKFVMNGGLICSNSSVRGSGAGRNSAIYLHDTGIMEMNGGSICHNTGCGYGGIDTNQTNSQLTITGGYVGENISLNGNSTADVNMYNDELVEITGGTFTQDVSQWLAPNTGLAYDEETGTYSLTDHIFNLWFYDPATGKQAQDVGPLQGNSAASLVSLGKLFYADYYIMELEVLTDVKIDKTVVIDYPMTINLNGKTLTAATGMDPMFRIESDVVVTGAGKLDARNGEAYVFILGKTDGTKGNLTIENGTFYGETTVASVTNGKLTINGGNFAVNPYEGSYEYTLNCIDANYKNGSAVIEVNGGVFYKFNPADNEAEGANTSFVAEGYVAEELTAGKWTVRALNYVAQVGETKYESLKAALEACTNGETVKLIADITYTDADVVYAHGGATGFGEYDQYNPAIIYIGGSRVDGVNYPSAVNAVLDLNGHTITSTADAYLFMIMDNAKLTFKDSVGTGAVINKGVEAPVIWVVGTETLVTIESGKYETDSATGLLHCTHGGDLVITDGEFSTNAEDASLLIMLNTKDRQNSKYFIKGVATVTISGGNFKGFNPEKVGDDNGATSIADIKFVDGCADDYKAVDNGDGTYGVVPKVYVAQLGETKYESIQAAIEAAEAGATVKLIADVTLEASVTVSKEVILDLNGKTIAFNADSGAAAINVTGTLTLVDSSAEKTGKIVRNSNTDCSAIALSGGNLIVESGSVISNYKGIQLGGTGKTNTITINGGVIEGATVALNVNRGTNTIAITGGKMVGDNAIHVSSQAAITEFTISGGEFVGNLRDIPEGKLSITGGTFTVDPSTYVAEGYKAVEENGVYTVAPNMIFEVHLTDANGEAHWLSPLRSNNIHAALKTAKVWYDSLQGTYNFTLKILDNCTIKEPVIVDFPLTIDLGDVTVSGDVYPMFRVQNDATLTVNGGTFVNSDYIFTLGASDSTSAGNLVINGGDFTGEITVVNVNKGVATINGGTFAASESAYGAQYLLNCIDANYKDGSAKITVNGGTFVGFNPADNAAEGASTNFVADGYIAETKDNGATYTVREANYVAQVGETKYESVQEAVNAANAGDTVKVLVRHAVAETIVIDKNITLDLSADGARIDAAATLCNTPVIRVLADVTITGANGIIDGYKGINSYAIIVGNSETAGNLYISEGMFRGVTTAISVTKGTAYISGGTFYTKHDGEGTDWGATYMLNCVDANYNNGTAKIIVTGGLFDGFDPYNNAAEGEGTNFCAEGYRTNLNGTWYSVTRAVASRTNGTTGQVVYFATLRSATTLTTGDATVYTVKLLEDLDLDVNDQFYGCPVLVNGTNIILDLNGKTITADWSKDTYGGGERGLFVVANGGNLTVTGNGTVKNLSDGTRNKEVHIFWNMNGSSARKNVITIENGTFYQYDDTQILYSQGHKSSETATLPQEVYVKGGTFISECADEVMKNDFFNAKDGNLQYTEITGGTFSMNPTDWELTIPDGYCVGQNAEGLYTVQQHNYESEYTAPSFEADGYTTYTCEFCNHSYNVVDEGTKLIAVAQVGDIKYESFAEAYEAAQAGDTVTLLADIALDTMIVNTKKITLDLNGKTITGTDNETKSFGLITNKGELTITGNGTITLKATNNRGWNAYSSVISNTVGGKLVVENGTIEHLGGTDMAYAIDNLTNGKGTYAETVINGGTIKSTYRAIRQFLNGVEAQNILTVNGGTIEGANKSIWMQDPSAKANTGTLTVGENAELVGDVYLFVTAGSTEWPVEVSIAAAALAGESTVVTGNVPAGYEVVKVNGSWTVETCLKGSGTEEDPFQINNLNDLIFFRDSVNAGETKYNAEGVVVALMADIDMTGIDWSVNIGDDCSATFDGIFDGQNHTISNLTSTETAKKADGYICTGLFGAIYGNAVVKNLTIDKANINTGDFTGNNAGIVVGFAYSCTGSIENVKVTNSTLNAAAVTGTGAIVGYDYYGKLTIKNCSVENTDVVGKSYVGGIIGYGSNNCIVTGSSFVDGDVTANGGAAGGIAGIFLDNAKAENCTVKEATIKAEHENWQNSAAVVVGTITSKATVTGTTVENVNVTAMVGSVSAEKPTAPVAKVAARIGDTYYTTFAKAYEAAQAGDTVTLLAPIVVAAGETLTLDKAVTIAYTSDVAGEDMITNRGTLNIGGDVKITYVNTDSTGSNVTVSTISAEPGSVLNVTGGTVENKTVKADGSSIYSYAIDLLTNGNLGDVTVTISGGTVYSDYMAIRQFNNGEACKNTLNVTGGNIYGAKRAIQVHLKNNAAYTNISGGKIEGGDYSLCFLTTSENLSVTGGEFIGAVYSGTNGIISGGTFDAEVYSGYLAKGYVCEENADGTYSVMTYVDAGYVAQNAQTGEVYKTVSAALAAAKAGETVQLITDAQDSYVLVTPGITLDLAGYTLTADYLVGFRSADIIDNLRTGLLKVAQDSVVLDAGNAYVPLWTGEGYTFTQISIIDSNQGMGLVMDGDKATFKFVTFFRDTKLLLDGASDNDLYVVIRVSWTTENGTAYQDFVYNDEQVKIVVAANGGKAFQLTFSGCEGLEDLTFTAVVMSNTGAEFHGTVFSAN